MILRWLTVLLLLALLPTVAWAQEDEDAALMPEGLQGEFTMGGAGVFGQSDSFKFGEYTGINDDTGYFIGGTNLTYNRDSYFMNLFTEDLGLDNRSIYWETGKTGSYTVYAEYNQIPHLLNNNTLTQFQNAGNTNLILNSGFGIGDVNRPLDPFDPAPGTPIAIVNRGFELENSRDTSLFGIKSTFGKLDFDMSYKRTERDGTQSIGGTSGNTGNPVELRSVILPDPIQQVAHEVHASLSHNGDEGQIQLNFDYSLFNNSSSALIWKNPFDNSDGGSRAPTNLISRDPDNSSWKVGLSGAYNLTDTTRISTVFQYGIMEQNESLLPFDISGAFLAPRAKADAQIQTIHGTFNLSSRPLPKLALNLRYRHYQTINDTPIQAFNYVINDDPNGQVGVANQVNNLPFDMTQNQVNATASYYAFKGTTFKLGYKFDHRKRDFREADETKESAVTAGVRSSYFKNVNFGYKVTLGVREEVDPYDVNKVIAARFGSVRPDTNPLMKRFDISEREQMKHSANINFSPTDRTTYGVYYNFVYDDYDTSQLGLQNSQRHDVTFDWTYTPSDATTLNVYYTYENIQTEQLNNEFILSFGGPPPPCATLNNPVCNWTANHDNDAHTVGAGVSHQYAENKVKLSADYWYSDSVEEITFTTGGFVVPEDMPKLKTRNHNARFTGRYRWSDHMDVSLSYLYQRFEIDDFATDNFAPGSTAIPEVLTLFGTLPNFDAHTVMAYFTYRIGASKS
jgi:MtrB/PioB family decaheme-associated outer membrane protein